MRISKTLLLLGVLGCAFFVRGADSEAQKKAREALEKKLGDAQPAVTEPQRPPAAPPKAAPAPAPAVPAPVAAPAATYSTPESASPDAIAKAREAVRSKLQEIGRTAAPVPAPTPAPAAAPAPVVIPTPAAAPAPAPVAPPVVAAPAPAPAPAAAAALPQSEVSPEAMSKAVQAMRQKLAELEGQAAPAPVAAPVQAAAPPPAPAPVPAAAPVAAQHVQTEPIAAPAVEAQPQADSEALAKALQAVRQKTAELENQPAPAPVTSAAPAPFVANAPVAANAPTPPVAPAQEQTLDPELLAKARAAVEQKMQQLGTQPPAAKVKPTPVVAFKPSRSIEPQKETSDPQASKPTKRAVRPPVFQTKLNFDPLEEPPLPISAEKKQRLDQLLNQYKADEISPEQYQAERAKILAN